MDRSKKRLMLPALIIGAVIMLLLFCSAGAEKSHAASYTKNNVWIGDTITFDNADAGDTYEITFKAPLYGDYFMKLATTGSTLNASYEVYYKSGEDWIFDDSGTLTNTPNHNFGAESSNRALYIFWTNMKEYKVILTFNQDHSGDTVTAFFDSTVKLNNTDISSADDIPVTIANAQQREYFRFTPETSGMVVVSSTSEEPEDDPYVEIYEEVDGYHEGKWITNDEDGKGSGYDFQAVFNVEAGKTYWIKVGYSNKDRIGDIFLNVLLKFKRYRFDPVTPFVYNEEDKEHGYFASINGTRYFRYSGYALHDGDKIVAEYENGDFVIGTYDAESGAFLDRKGRPLPEKIRLYDRQTSRPWVPGKDNVLYLTYGEHTIEVPVEVIPKKEEKDPEPAPAPAPSPASDDKKTDSGRSSTGQVVTVPKDDTAGTSSSKETKKTNKKTTISGASVKKSLAINTKSIKTAARFHSKKMVISWKKVKGANSYRIVYRKAGGKWHSKWTGSKNKTSLKKLKRKGLYEFRLQAFKKTPSKWYKSKLSKVNYRYYEMIRGINVKRTEKAAYVMWKKLNGASGYELLHSGKKNMSAQKTLTVKAGKAPAAVITDISQGKKHFYRVRPFKVRNGKKYKGVLTSVRTIKKA